MNEDLTTLKSFIQKKMIKDFSFDFNSDQTDMQISLTSLDYREIKREAEKINITKHELDKIIDDVRGQIKFEPKIKDMLKIIPEELENGQHLRLVTKDEKGEAIEELIYLGKNSFVLIRHERGSLQLLDELKSINSPWNVGGYIDFHVFRDGERVIKDEIYSVYRTKKIVKIQKLIPQFDFEKFFKPQLEDE